MSAKSSALPISPLTAFVAAAAVVVGTLAFRHWRRQHHGHGHGHAHSHGGAVPAAGSDVNAREADGDARFSALAETYDSNPSLKFVNSKIVEALTSKLPFPLDAKATDVLEFGCGTGAVSMAISSHVRSVVALDAAEGMIAEVNRKIKAANGTADNVTAVCKRLDAPEDLPLFGGAATHTDRFDVIFTTLAFHHLSDPARVMTLFRALLRPGGVVVVADLIANDATRQMMANAVKAGHGGGHAHGHSHDHSHGGGHGHSHGGGHGHSHGGGSDAKGDGADGKPTDVFHTGFDPNQFRKLPGHCGLTLVSMDAPYFQVDMFGSRVDMFLAVASKPKPTPNADVKAKDA